MNLQSVAIIGAGPSGIAMGIQLKRYGMEAVIFEKDQPGGLLKNANLVENYPGFPGGISGPELVELMVNQFMDSRITLIPEEVTSLDFKGDAFVLRTSKRRYQFQWVAVASGTRPIKASKAEVSTRAEQVIHYEVYPILKEKWKKIVIIGAGDAAFDYALNLAWQNEVTILNRTASLAALPVLVERARNHPNITYQQNIAISSMDLDKSGSRVDLLCTSPAGMRKISTDHLIFAIGREPSTQYFSKTVLDGKEQLISGGRLFMIGDVKNEIFRQTAIAVGDGVLAAMKLYKACSEARLTQK
jgi:thioredoxin reductase (NADPH)